jgi:hypothetical protein
LLPDRQHLLLTILPTIGKRYHPDGYEFGAKPNLKTWFAEIFLSAMSFVLQESIKYVEEEMKEMDEKGRVDVPPRTSKDGH